MFTLYFVCVMLNKTRHHTEFHKMYILFFRLYSLNILFGTFFQQTNKQKIFINC